ncbi:4-hydroxythreonine-4-phosphate dehydrogenase PdxA [Novipirellula artificiosorum]|uniref:4-hydroxythreonine-4-phosphate dehydrogenase n=1 Tax=Novipirellula artificiosorum TaxID=2528016 RepID=A0A5C6D4L5_9BACT|nr:4-hydroxythreonine-4-phosphate dehydrogenase PdxA [Novipirellula artificiosorum]TWU31760.1 4-hydroxythreonine-4-phosphate dehydrogenase [Novipirellula artificiosorum]
MSDSAQRTRPRIAISVGDVGGVGPELSLCCAANQALKDRCLPVLYGPFAVLERVAVKLGYPLPEIVDVPVEHSESIQPGRFSRATGQASFDAVCRAIDATMNGETLAMVTGPIQKEAWHAAGITFPGHTELLAAKTGVDDFSMMLTSDTISCVLATIHVPLADVPAMLSIELVLRTIRHAADALERRRGRSPRVAVCGLNPHAGENGLFSHGEEASVIEPAIAQARDQGIDVVGPLPPDTAFTPRMRRNVDVYVCMYHDQGLIPLKALAFDDAVNVTLGLPIVRTSVDHGTALDLAWQGVAQTSSMLAAIEMAIDLAERP